MASLTARGWQPDYIAVRKRSNLLPPGQARRERGTRRRAGRPPSSVRPVLSTTSKSEAALEHHATPLLKSKIHRGSRTANCITKVRARSTKTCSKRRTSSRTSGSTSGTSTMANASATYAINGERGSGMISLNGSAARRAQLGDLVIIAAFAMVDEAELKAGWKPDWCSSTRQPDQGQPRPRADAELDTGDLARRSANRDSVGLSFGAARARPVQSAAAMSHQHPVSLLARPLMIGSHCSRSFSRGSEATSHSVRPCAASCT